jgi:hypothetical protein
MRAPGGRRASGLAGARSVGQNGLSRNKAQEKSKREKKFKGVELELAGPFRPGRSILLFLFLNFSKAFFEYQNLSEKYK